MFIFWQSVISSGKTNLNFWLSHWVSHDVDINEYTVEDIAQTHELLNTCFYPATDIKIIIQSSLHTDVDAEMDTD